MGVLGTLKKTLAAAVIVLGTATVSSAATFGSVPGVGGGTNDMLDDAFGGTPTSRNGWYGAALYLVGAVSNIKATFIGREAGFNNTFHWNGSQIFSNAGSAAGANNTFNNVATGLLNFAFGINSSTPSVINGANPDGSVLPGRNQSNFFVTFENENASGGQMAWLFLDDNGSLDDNHDDMVIKLEIVGGGSLNIVPLPAAGFLLLGGLGALGAVARRRKAA